MYEAMCEAVLNKQNGQSCCIQHSGFMRDLECNEDAN